MKEKNKGERYDHGRKTMMEMMGASGSDIIEHLQQLHPDIADLVISGYSDIYARPGLEKKQRAIVTLTSLITQGAHEQLHAHTMTALHVGLTPNEILEIIIQCTAYVGFPRALSSLRVVQEVLKDKGLEFEISE
ncbi:carboxymuconolactone decarboxylase family protein [Bacillus tuaregi]|uniref:carboxymuconolactone decarboxylase family protein n=1 Tax=Bacillus tuaregi TaxID=1816695 RepID=UPI0008F83566|nr:carboxymuconolactone decarboxylase family protein [Bacillus tuaregi]